jgi:hypothetical protein
MPLLVLVTSVLNPSRSGIVSIRRTESELSLKPHRTPLISSGIVTPWQR